MSVLLELVALFVFARLFGEVCERIHVPALIGEILAGVLLGPLVLKLVIASDPILLVADLGIFFIVYEAGMEMTLRGVKRIIKESGAAVAAGSFILPFLLGFHVGLVFDYELRVSLFLGLALSLTALPVSVRILTDFGWLNTDVGQTIITAGLLCDIAGLIILAMITNLSQAVMVVDAFSLTVTVLKVLLFFLTLLTVERVLSLKERSLSKHIVAGSERLLSKGAAFSVPLIAVFAFALFAQFLGLHFIIGTFFGTVIVAEHLFPIREGRRVREAISTISRGFLAPIFFAYLGLLTVTFEWSLAPLFATLLVAAVAGKMAGSYAGARAAGFLSWSASVIAVGMNGRGAMELVIALVGLNLGLISQGIFSVLVLIGLITTLMTPLMLRYLAGMAPAAKRSKPKPKKTPGG